MEEWSWLITDHEQGLWLDSFQVTARDLGLPPDQRWSVAKRTLRGGPSDGVDVVEVDNGKMRFTVVPTRGMGIWRGEIEGESLGWLSPVRGPVHPKLVDLGDRGGLGFIQGFDEWIVRCGLESNGAPGEDIVPDNNGNPVSIGLNLHGKIANLPAHRVEVRIQRQPPFEISVLGHVTETALFCPNLELRTRIGTRADASSFTIEDTVVNRGATPAEFELLYHCNFGAPFLEKGSRLRAPAALVAPRDPRAQEGMRTYDSYLGPTPGYVEQVYWYELLADPETHRTVVALENSSADRAAALRFDRRQLPCFTQWKNTGALEDGYVTGLEPATNYPNVRRFEREQGRVPKLGPAGSYSCKLELELATDPEAVQRIAGEIAALQRQQAARVHETPQPRYSMV